MEWKRQVPDQAGFWLRLNAGGRVQLHHVFMLNGELVIQWGWTGNGNLLRFTTETRRRTGGFMWYGPIQNPPRVEERWIDSAPPAGEEE